MRLRMRERTKIPERGPDCTLSHARAHWMGAGFRGWGGAMCRAIPSGAAMTHFFGFSKEDLLAANAE